MKTRMNDDPEVEAYFASAHAELDRLGREEARLRLTCAALTGLIGTALYPSHEALARQAVDAAEWCLDVLYPEPAAGEVGRG